MQKVRFEKKDLWKVAHRLVSYTHLDNFCIDHHPYIRERQSAVMHYTSLYYISLYLGWEDQHGNTNMNDKDHLVGQLTM